jgi:putative ABC transport system permease protein
MNAFQQDLRQAWRLLLRSPGFTLAAVLTLSLGIGATSALFSVLQSVVLQPLPYSQPERIVQLWQLGAEGNRMNVSDANFADLKEQSQSFDALAQFQQGQSVTVVSGQDAMRASASTVSAGFFDAIGVGPSRGRAFMPAELQVGGAPALIVSHDFWQRALGARPELSDTTLRITDRVYAVVGVMPAGFTFPGKTALWIPRELTAPLPSRTAHNWRVIGRLHEGASLQQAQQEVSAIARRLKAQHGDDTWMSDAALVPLHEQMVGRVRPALLLLLGAAAFLLCIACANVANLLLARTAARQREIAVRLALGAGRTRLARQFFVEALVLSLCGGSVGILFAFWGVDALRALGPVDLPRLDEIRVQWPVLALTLSVSVLMAGVLGLVTLVRGTDANLRDALAQSQRTMAGGRSSGRMRSGLVVAQVALTVVLLVGAGLLGRSLLRILSLEPGYRTSGSLVVDLPLSWPADAAAHARTTHMLSELIARVGALPGVVEAGGVNDFPLGGSYSDGTFLVMSHAAEVSGFEDFQRLMKDPTRTGSAAYRVASEGYFRAMGIPLVRGRLFDERDAADAQHVALISESLARTRWPDEDPLGKLVQFGNMDGDLRPFTIVGVVGDVREQSVEAEPEPTFYGYFRQRKVSKMHVVAHGPAQPQALVGAARAVVRELDPEVAPSFRSVEQVFAASLAPRRFSLLLVGIFGAAALLLAVMGIYAVVAYVVAQRTAEFGIRIAFGARAQDIRRLVLGHGARMAAAGIVVGLLAAASLSRLIASLLYGVSATDPVAFSAVALLLGGVAVAASLVPALRATRVDPMHALRNE